MVVQPKTLIASLIAGAVLIVSAAVYFIFFKGEQASNVSSVAMAAVDPVAQGTSLYDMAVFANLVRSAYDQKIAAGDADDIESKMVCGEVFKDVDLSLLAQTLSVDIEQKIDEIVNEKQIVAATWSGCSATCTCSTLADLFDKAIEVGQGVAPEALEVTQQSAEALTTAAAIKCAQTAKSVCQSALARKYAEQAATIE